ncbi:SRPBCC family protein [Streptacidiphilus sp. ASG 303]|uniref:SRPBCC family protein n=1 Tax=Streptacidiphilus sp. ASG 303 TaxID=2896847 RepID=UPI001E4D1312|nr:SRPBCC family protein [Streptacidiphilus sp. ASG 303]MCD0483501.1 SRPBCC family protein [Streptacidiphilus sp. ASG 303]
MWTYEHTQETAAPREAVWRLWADVENWGTWNADIEKVAISGPFAAGAEITMAPAGQDPVHLRVTEAVENELFVDEARFDGLVLRTAHRIDPAGPGRIRVVYRMEITGPAADEAGPHIGPAVTGDWPDTVAALVARAEQGR